MPVCRRRDQKPKVVYTTQDQAAAQAGRGENAYRCPICDQWHVGHPQPAQKEARIQRAKKRHQRKLGSW